MKRASGTFALVGLIVATSMTTCGGETGDEPAFDTALLSGGGEVGIINLWDKITDDCQRVGIQGKVSSGTVVGVTLVRNDCTPKMYFVGTGRSGEDGWVNENFVHPR